LLDKEVRREYDSDSQPAESNTSYSGSSGYSTRSAGSSSGGQGFTGYGRASDTSRQQQQYYQQQYTRHNDPDTRRTWDNASFQEQVIR